MKQLLLSNNKIATLDEVDWVYLVGWQWHQNSWGYVYRPQRFNGVQGSVVLHIEILKRMGLVVFGRGDHKDRNTLNNCRENLRLATQAQNGVNANLKSNNTSGFRNIYFDKCRDKWVARIRLNGETLWIGEYALKEQAARAYDYMAKLHHGEFAVLNFPSIQR